MTIYKITSRTQLTARVLRQVVVREKAQDRRTFVVIADWVKAQDINLPRQGQDTNWGAAEIVEREKKRIKVGKSVDIKIGDKVELHHKGYGEIGTFEVTLVDPQSTRWRNTSLYVSLTQSNKHEGNV